MYTQHWQCVIIVHFAGTKFLTSHLLMDDLLDFEQLPLVQLDLLNVETPISAQMFALLCQATALTKLVLDSLTTPLAAVTSDISSLQNLRTLVISAGEDEVHEMLISSELSKLQQLSQVTLYNAEDCLYSLCNIAALKRLSLTSSYVMIPAHLSQLRLLSRLELQCSIFDEPPSSAALSALEGLRHCRIHCHTTQPVTLLSAIGKLTGLAHLDLFFRERSTVQESDVRLLHGATALTYLSLSMELQSFECSPAWTCLQELDLGCNHLTTLPDNLPALAHLTKLCLGHWNVTFSGQPPQAELLGPLDFIEFLPRLQFLDLASVLRPNALWSLGALKQLLSARHAAAQRARKGWTPLQILF